MNRQSKVLALFSAIVLMFVLSTAMAAEFSPALEAELAKAADSELVSAIVILESPVDIRALDWKLHVEKADLPTRHREVITALQFNAESTQPAFVAEFDEAIALGKMTGYTAYWIENLFVIQAEKQFIESLRPRGDVRFVTENFRPELIAPQQRDFKPGYDYRRERDRNPLDTRFVSPGIEAVGARRIVEELGITGNGVLMANCDTGVDGAHPALASRWAGLNRPWYHCWKDDLALGETFPADHYGHGTHVMGTECGLGITGVDSQWVGCAINAEWMCTNAINQGVSGNFDNDIISDYQWFADPDSNVNTMEDVPDVIQNSWGVFTGLGYAQCFDLWNTFIMNCEAAGPVVTWSAGNESTSGLRSPAIYSINAHQIFSVGAVDATNFAPPYPLAGFSSQGPTPCAPAVPNDIKPEISAPGVDVYSSIPGGGYDGSWSGTSMAGPHVAGIAGLMREACPNCDHITIKDAIMNNAIDYGVAGEDNQYGHGFIDGYAAVVAVSNLGRIGGFVTNLNNGLPLQGALVQNLSPLASTTLTDANGEYYLALQEGTHNVQYSKFGFISQTINGLSVVEGDTTYQNVALAEAPQGTVSGTVTDCFGNPAVGATVTVLNTPVPPAFTDGTGFYSITLPQGTYDMTAFGAGCGTAQVDDVVIGASTTQNFTLPADPIYSCSVPDAGGYSACENGDQGGCTYTWIEISPLAGGPGTNTGLTGDDEAMLINIPFTFRFYGVDYTSVYVNSNGTLNFTTYFSSYFNTALPVSFAGPSIFPFWDDLYLPSGGSDVSYYYYAPENAFIIEWYNIQHFPGSDPRETFQVWLYNIASNPGPNGSSQMRMQYQTISSGTSTVGTQDDTQTIYSQYAYDATLDPNSQGLANGRVITYGGCSAVPTGTIAGLITDCAGGGSPFATVSFPGSFYPPVTADGSGNYSVDVVGGTYTVRADNLPCTYQQQAGVVVTEGNTTIVNLTLRAPTRIQGTITHCAGGPAVGATVSFPGSLVPDQTTDGAGFYSVVLDAGTYSVRAANNNCSAVQQDNNVVAEATTITVNLTLAAPGTLEGTVTSCTGGPAVGATITLSGGPVTPPPANTNGAGFYQFTGLPAGNYSVAVSFGGCAPAGANVVINSGSTTTQNFTLVSDPRAQCSIPDPYGYYYCEDTDVGGMPFAWQAISPQEGGPGTPTNIVCDDCFGGPYAFPFAFQFYGTVYTEYYIGSNGYMSFGSGSSTYFNGCFPQDFMPAGVYAFWDDLYTFPASGGISTYYDAANNWLVVEWYSVSHCCSDANYETFQIIIYDEGVYSSATGDNHIKTQYHTPLAIYFDNHTVGIKTATGPNFSQYVCNAVLDPSAFGVATGRSIYFTTGPGCDLGPADIAVNPASVSGSAPLGGTDTENLQICNNGFCPLRWNISFTQFSPALASASVNAPYVYEMSKEQLDRIAAIMNGEKVDVESNTRNRDQLDAQGGPDAFGYRWIDSDEPGGPAYDWVEINAIGTNTGLSFDDQTVSVGLPWAFEYYGITYNSVNVSSNGNAHFGAANAQYTNQPLPCNFCPLAMLAPFWDDLYLPTGGAVYYYDDAANNRFIIEWDDVPHIAGIGTYNFQIHLHQNGVAYFQYETLTGDVSQCGIGTNNETGTVGLQVADNQAYLHNNMAIRINAIPDWLTISPPTNGSLDPGQCVNLTLNFDAGDLPEGTYTGELTIDNNDPDEDPTLIPVSFTIGMNAPTALTVYYVRTTNLVTLRWTATGSPQYRIYSDTDVNGAYGTLEGTSATNSFSFPLPANSRLFFVVTSWDGAGAESLPTAPVEVGMAKDPK